MLNVSNDVKDTWACGVCGLLNSFHIDYCEVCGTKRIRSPIKRLIPIEHEIAVQRKRMARDGGGGGPSSVWDLPPPETQSYQRPRLTKEEKKLQKKYPPPFPKATQETWLERDYAKYRCPKCSASIMRADIIACVSCGAALRQDCDGAPTRLRAKRPALMAERQTLERKAFDALLSSSSDEEGPTYKISTTKELAPPGFAQTETESKSELTSTVATLTDREAIHQSWSDILGCHVSHIQSWSMEAPPCKLVCEACGSLYDEFQMKLKVQQRIIYRITVFLIGKGPIPKLLCQGDCCDEDFLSRLDTIRSVKVILDNLLLPPANNTEATQGTETPINEGITREELSDSLLERDPIEHKGESQLTEAAHLPCQRSNPHEQVLGSSHVCASSSKAARLSKVTDESESIPTHPPGIPFPVTSSRQTFTDSTPEHQRVAIGQGYIPPGDPRPGDRDEGDSSAEDSSDDDAFLNIRWEKGRVAHPPPANPSPGDLRPDVPLPVTKPQEAPPQYVRDPPRDSPEESPQHEDYRSVISNEDSLQSGTADHSRSPINTKPFKHSNDYSRRRRQSKEVRRQTSSSSSSSSPRRRGRRSDSSSSSESLSWHYKRRGHRRDENRTSRFPYNSEPLSKEHLIDFLMHTRMLILCGPHLAGKTYIANLLARCLNFKVFSSDAVRKVVGPYIRSHYRTSNTQKWPKIVIDKPNLTVSERRRWWDTIDAASMPEHRIGLLCIWPGDRKLRRRYMDEYHMKEEQARISVNNSKSKIEPVNYKGEIKKENVVAITNWEQVIVLQDVIENLGQIIGSD